MLPITLPAMEYFDESKSEFITVPAVEMKFEHSLLSLSKWEMKYHKPFLTKEEKSSSETIYYLKCMCINDKNFPDEVYTRLARDKELMQKITDYLADPMTATTINKQPGGGGREIITNELIYYQMSVLNIPFECEKWHLNRLLMLIQVAAIKQSPPKKMSREEVYARNQRLNAERRAKLNSAG